MEGRVLRASPAEGVTLPCAADVPLCTVVLSVLSPVFDVQAEKPFSKPALKYGLLGRRQRCVQRGLRPGGDGHRQRLRRVAGGGEGDAVAAGWSIRQRVWRFSMSTLPL